MKKAIKILIYFLASLVVLTLLLLVFHDQILSIALKRAISNKSGGKVELKLEEIDLNLLEGSISVSQPELLLDTVYVDENQNVLLNRIRFENIEIDHLKIRELITEGDILADRFVVDRPQLWITEEGYNEQSSFHPEKLVNFLNNNPNSFGGIKIQISDVEISYGSIRITEMVAADMDPGKVDFTVILGGFNTMPDSADDKTRYLYSEEISFKVKQLRRQLKSGYLLEIDSATFSTFKKDLIAGGIRFQPTNFEDRNAIGLYAGKLVFNDLDLEEVRGMEDFTLRSMILADGHFISYQNNSIEMKPDTAQRAGLDILHTILREFELDTLLVSNFQYYNIHDQADTMLAANGLQFLATYLTFDSSDLDKLVRNVDFKRIAFQTGQVNTKMVKGLNLSYGKLGFSNEDDELVVKDFRMIADTGFSEKSLELKLSDFIVQGFSLEKLQQGQIQNITLIAKNPIADIDLEHPLLKSNGGQEKLDINKLLNLEKIRIEKGNLKLIKDKNFDLALNGLDFEVDDLKVNSTDSSDLQFENLFVKYDNLDLSIDGNALQIQTGHFIFDDDQLSVNKLKGTTWIGKPLTRNDFSLGALRLQDFDLKKFVTEEDLFIRRISLTAPSITGGLHIKQTKDTISPSPNLIPLDIEIGAVDVLRGSYQGKIMMDTNEADISFDYHLKLEKLLAYKGDTLIAFLKKLGWDFGMEKVYVEAADHKMKIDSLISNTFTSQFRIKNLNIRANEPNAFSPDGLRLRNVSLPLLDVSLLNYSMLLNQDSIELERLTLSQPVIDIVLPKGSRERKPDTLWNFDLNNYLLFSYNTVDVTDLYVNVEKPGDSSFIQIGIRDFTFKHDAGSDNDLNLTNNVHFSFKDLNYRDTIQGKFLTVDEGMLLSEKGEFRIKGIHGGNLTKTAGQEKEFGLTGTEFETSGISFSGIYLTESLPSQLKISRLNIDDFDVDISQKEDLSKKMVFKLNLEVMRRFNKTITAVNVDTVSLQNINYHHTTYRGKEMKSVHVDSIGVLVQSIKVDTSMIGQSEPDLVGNLMVDLKGRSMITNDSLYEIKTGYLHYDFPTRSVTIDSFHLRPRYKDEEFFKRAEFQTDRAIIAGKKIELNDFSIDDLIKHDHLHFGSVKLVDFKFDLCRDKRYPFKPGIYKELLREQIMSVDQKFTVDSLLLEDAYLDYKEIEEKTGQSGTIFFDRVNASAYNLTNNIDSTDRNSRIFLNANAYIMGQSRMDVNIYFPLYPDSVAFWLSAKSEKIDMVSLNDITENLLGLGILNGQGSIDIPLIIAGNDIAKGNMTFRYKKIKIARYDRKKEQMNTGFMSPFINFLINDLVVKSNNPKFARKPRIGQVYFERDTRKGLVNYAWKGVLSGMLSTLGFNTKEQRQEKKAMKKNQ